MPPRGGKTTFSGTKYQAEITALYLGRMRWPVDRPGLEPKDLLLKWIPFINTQALNITLEAILAARFAGRRAVFEALAQGAPVLAAKDGGWTLWEVYNAILKVDAWWGA